MLTDVSGFWAYDNRETLLVDTEDDGVPPAVVDDNSTDTTDHNSLPPRPVGDTGAAPPLDVSAFLGDAGRPWLNGRHPF